MCCVTRGMEGGREEEREGGRDDCYTYRRNITLFVHIMYTYIHVIKQMLIVTQFYLIPLNLLVSSVGSQHSFSRSSYKVPQSWNEFSCSPLYFFPSISMSFLRYGLLYTIF